MNKYKIYFCGERTYFATDSNEATKLAEQDAKTIPSNFNIEVLGEVFSEAYCITCKAIKMSSKADYQSEFTCNTCGSEVYTKQLKAEKQ